jgi:hypothetical protein
MHNEVEYIQTRKRSVALKINHSSGIDLHYRLPQGSLRCPEDNARCRPRGKHRKSPCSHSAKVISVQQLIIKGIAVVAHLVTRVHIGTFADEQLNGRQRTPALIQAQAVEGSAASLSRFRVSLACHQCGARGTYLIPSINLHARIAQQRQDLGKV